MNNKEFLKHLYKDHNLVEEDVYIMERKTKGKTKKIPVIRRTGIEKIQYQNNIQVEFEVICCGIENVVYRAVSFRNDEKQIETFGSASKNNCKIHFLAETAEARALARVVIKTMKWTGVYGQAEMEDQPRESLNSKK